MHLNTTIPQKPENLSTNSTASQNTTIIKPQNTTAQTTPNQTKIEIVLPIDPDPPVLPKNSTQPPEVVVIPKPLEPITNQT